MSDNLADQVTDNPGRSRYELTVDGSTAFAEYRKAEGERVFVHTEVPDALSGRGVGSKLVRGALDDVRTTGLKVVAECPFVASFIERHPDYRSLLART